MNLCLFTTRNSLGPGGNHFQVAVYLPVYFYRPVAKRFFAPVIIFDNVKSNEYKEKNIWPELGYTGNNSSVLFFFAGRETTNCIFYPP